MYEKSDLFPEIRPARRKVPGIDHAYIFGLGTETKLIGNCGLEIWQYRWRVILGSDNLPEISQNITKIRIDKKAHCSKMQIVIYS